MDQTEQGMVSVVVCTFNRAPALSLMLDSFFQQRMLKSLKYELLIIDNNSSDDTAGVVNEYLKRGNVRYLLESKQGLSFARNRGIAEAKGEFISFLDDDVLLHESWLTNLKACFDDTQADVVGGKVSLKFESPPKEWLGGVFRSCLSEVDFGTSRKVLSNGDFLYGANLSIRREIFQLVGHFRTNVGRRKDEMISGEETEILRRVVAKNGKLLYDPDVLVEHQIGTERLQWQYFVRRACGDGVTQECLEAETSSAFQCLRVCKATWALAKAGYTKAAGAFRTGDPYRERLAEYMLLRQRSYLRARWARLIRQLRNQLI